VDSCCLFCHDMSNKVSGYGILLLILDVND
jgi:hypothetical protein